MKRFEHIGGKKQCSCCGKWLPATLEFFTRDSERWDKLTHRCKECRKGVTRTCCRNLQRQSPEERRQMKKIFRDNNRLKVLRNYSNSNIPICACCGEKHIEFLIVDHIHNGGNRHRRKIGTGSGSSFYHWLIKRKYPKGFQVLCHNCNMAKSQGGCPHQKDKVMI